MDKYQETFNTWNKIAELYQDKFMGLDLYNASYDGFCALIQKQNPGIFEIGCGPGNITKYLLQKRPDFQIDAIDIAPNMIALAKSNNPNADFKVMDSRDIDQLKTQYDGVMCGFCIPYLSKSDVEKLIVDCEKLLKVNGILYLSFVEGKEADSGYQLGSSCDRTYFYYHATDDLNDMLKTNRFENQNIFHVNYEKSDGSTETHTILLAKKI